MKKSDTQELRKIARDLAKQEALVKSMQMVVARLERLSQIADKKKSKSA